MLLNTRCADMEGKPPTMLLTASKLKSRQLAAGLAAVAGIAFILVPDGPALASEVVTETADKAERQSLFGNYLSGRLATRQREMGAAAGFYERALEKDPDNDNLIKQALRAEVATAHWSRARQLAEQVITVEKGHRLARLLLGISAFKDGKYDDARLHFDKASNGPIGELGSALASAWSYAAEDDENGAFKALAQLKKAKWAKFYRLYQRALIADVLGSEKEARKAYGELFEEDRRTLRLALGYAEHAARHENFKLARSIMDRHVNSVAVLHPLARAELSDVHKNEAPQRLVRNATDGLAEVFFSLGEALTSEGGLDIGAIYLQFALYIRPDFPMALMTLGSVYEATRRYDEAIATYHRISSSSPLYFNGEIRRALNLDQQEKFEDARDSLSKLVDRFEPEVAQTPVLDEVGRIKQIQTQLAALGLYEGEIDGVWGPAARAATMAFQRRQSLGVDGVVGPVTEAALGLATQSTEEVFKRERALRALLTLGTVFRRKEKFREAANVYTRAIALIEKPEKKHWRYFYSRGVSYERMKDWPKAEADLEKAMELNPDQPLVLNYLGYSWVDQNLHLTKAMALIKKAVRLKPDDGYIVDSLGWAYYRQGNFEEATKYLERAVELLPEDPTINDHLGDAYWHVGRLLEARYQWRQALGLEPEPKDAILIRRKLERGLEGSDASRVVGQAKQKTETKSTE